MKKISAIFLIISSLLLTACSEEGGGVILTEDPRPAPTGSPGPFGGPVNNDEAIPDPSLYAPAYNSDTFQQLIDNAPENGIIDLDRDVNLNFSILINKAITIRSAAALNRRAKIKSINASSMFQAQSDNFTLRNVEIEMVNTSEFIASNLIADLPQYNNFTLEDSVVKLRGLSSFKVTMNGTLINKSTILGLATLRQSNLNMTNFIGNNLTLTANNLIDVNNSYMNPLLLFKNNGILLRQNVIRGFCEPLYAAITGSEISNALFESNILHDANADRSNTQLGSGDVGSIAISFQFSNGISDNGLANTYSTQLFRLDDADELVSTNINLTAGLFINPFDKDDLFNYPPTEDFTPLCSLGANPTISLSPRASWSSYVGPSSGNTYYYSGAIKPACL